MFGRSREEKEYQARAEQRQAERVLHPALFEPFFNTRSEPLEDLAKARWYLDRELERLKNAPDNSSG